jgi:hypothetical protein
MAGFGAARFGQARFGKARVRMNMTVFDTNRANLSGSDLNVLINTWLDAAALEKHQTPRNYLGASGIGSECLRKVQYDWQCDAVHPARTRTIFDRGHLFESLSRRDMMQAGFVFDPDERGLAFTAADGLFQGHADGKIVDGPTIPGLVYPCLWEHKALSAAGYRKIEKDGVDKHYPHYAAQVYLYQAYLDLTNPALFTVTNSDTCHRLHLTIPFDATLAQAASDRAVLVIKATQAGELLDRIAQNPTDWRCKMCSHKDRCWG